MWQCDYGTYRPNDEFTAAKLRHKKTARKVAEATLCTIFQLIGRHFILCWTPFSNLPFANYTILYHVACHFTAKNT